MKAVNFLQHVKQLFFVHRRLSAAELGSFAGRRRTLLKRTSTVNTDGRHLDAFSPEEREREAYLFLAKARAADRYTTTT